MHALDAEYELHPCTLSMLNTRIAAEEERLEAERAHDQARQAASVSAAAATRPPPDDARQVLRPSAVSTAAAPKPEGQVRASATGAGRVVSGVSGGERGEVEGEGKDSRAVFDKENVARLDNDDAVHRDAQLSVAPAVTSAVVASSVDLSGSLAR
jgi:hypothetical protein